MATLQDSQNQEKQAAEDFGGWRNPGSGSGPYRKNDVRTPDFSIECKVTGKASFRLTLKDLLLARKYALLDGRTMLWEIDMQGHAFVIAKKDDFLDIWEDAKKQREVSS